MRRGFLRPAGCDRRALWSVGLIALAVCAGCEQSPAPVAFTLHGETMGTTYEVDLAMLPEGETPEAIQAAIDAALERVNDQMSTYRPDSEISRFNDSDSTDWFPVSEATATVVGEAQRISGQSDGAFDVTVMPLVNLWSFGPEARPDAVPSDDELAARRQHVGHEKLHVRADPPALKKSDAELSVDLSAIAKGHGVDVVAELLDERGVTGYMVEIGGEIRTKGTKADGTKWKIAIEKPVAGERAIERILELNDAALATSGDYRNYFEADGVRYSHTIDPRTGKPISHTLVSVSVLADSCMTADACATTVMVLGPDDGYDWLLERDCAAALIVKDGETFIEKPTPSFKSRLDGVDSDSGKHP